MTFTKIAVAGGLALLGFVCWLAASGVGPAREGLVSLVALVALVAGGNLLAGRARAYAERPAPTTRDSAPSEPVAGMSSDGEPAP
jgi:hypothetical protein